MRDLIPLFLEYVEVVGDCWLWTVVACENTYGTTSGPIRIRTGEGVAHRASWVIFRGPIPDGLWVLHHCDERRCANPYHLYLGTRQDNVRDIVSRGRQGNRLKAREAAREALDRIFIKGGRS